MNGSKKVAATSDIEKKPKVIKKKKSWHDLTAFEMAEKLDLSKNLSMASEMIFRMIMGSFASRKLKLKTIKILFILEFGKSCYLSRKKKIYVEYFQMS